MTDTPKTLKEAKERLARVGMTITKREGEYRVNFRDGKESTASYHSDLDDAFNTALENEVWRRTQGPA